LRETAVVGKRVEENVRSGTDERKRAGHAATEAVFLFDGGDFVWKSADDSTFLLILLKTEKKKKE
jgi:hypothetical protein